MTLPKRKPGAPTTYSQDTAACICAEMAEGRSLRSICRDDGMPALSTVFLWLSKHPEFSDQYARAREAQADALFEDVLEIADDARNDWMERNAGDDAGWQANGENIQRSKLRVDARKWMAGKLRPKVYGDKQEVAHDVTDRMADLIRAARPLPIGMAPPPHPYRADRE